MVTNRIFSRRIVYSCSGQYLRVNTQEVLLEINVAKKRIPELKVETLAHKANFIYLSLLEYKRETYLCIIDNVTPSEIGAYVLDYAEQEEIPVTQFLSIATKWFYGKSEKHPLSVEVAKWGLTEKLSKIYRTFDATYVSRIVGQSFAYDNMQKNKVKRRRVVPVQEGVEIVLKKK